MKYENEIIVVIVVPTGFYLVECTNTKIRLDTLY